MRVVAFNTEPKTIDRFLAHQGNGDSVTPFMVQPVPVNCKALEAQSADQRPKQKPGDV